MAKSTSVVADTDSAKDAPKPTRKKKTRSTRSKAGDAEKKSPETKPAPAEPKSDGGGSSQSSSGASEAPARSSYDRPSAQSDAPPQQQRQQSSGGYRPQPRPQSPSGPGQGQSSQYSGGYQNQSRLGKRKKNKKRKNQNRPYQSGGVSLPEGSVPSDEEIAREAETLRQTLAGKKGDKDAIAALGKAVREENHAALSRHIDFPPLRASGDALMITGNSGLRVRAMRLNRHGGSMRRWIRSIAWSLANWSGGGRNRFARRVTGFEGREARSSSAPMTTPLST